ncbi:MAG: electron transfer flavoprotein subunit beta [Anaerolineales bacterium]|nr:electron transfer flavoprotein subunit beta [Anaerolineales bacterium]
MTHILVTAKLVPDLVEELEIAESGTALDMTWLRLIINEFDDHAIEQAIILKERSGCEVTVIAPDQEGMDDVLFTAAAKGADRIIKLVGDFEEGVNNHALARTLAASTKEIGPDLILTGVQGNDDFDGSVGPYLAEYLGMTYVGYVAGVTLEGDKAIVHKEYPGGLIAELEVTLPAVLGIQAAEQPPRYVAVSKVRQMMKEASIDEVDVLDLDPSGGLEISSMYLPEAAERAEMLDGDEEEIAARLVEIFKEIGVV